MDTHLGSRSLFSLKLTRLKLIANFPVTSSPLVTSPHQATSACGCWCPGLRSTVPRAEQLNTRACSGTTPSEQQSYLPSPYTAPRSWTPRYPTYYHNCVSQCAGTWSTNNIKTCLSGNGYFLHTCERRSSPPGTTHTHSVQTLGPSFAMTTMGPVCCTPPPGPLGMPRLCWAVYEPGAMWRALLSSADLLGL